ncbi:MAG TPA: AAA family ATPase [Rhodocyclaceae bacterium]
MSMYLNHFGLREVPFSITPHTEFFFSGANRGATLEALVYAVTHDEGIVKVTGEVGSGKTMLCRMLLERLPANVATVYLANPSLSRDEILYALSDELAMPAQPQRVHQLLRGLQAHLVDLYAAGRQVVVLIDEAHAMPPESLEEVRLLSNLESKRHKLLKIVLFGQPELDEMLSRSEMRQLRERVTHNFGLEPLTQTDIGGYLMFRMRAAGYHGPDLFTDAAVRLIAEASLGLSRRINIVADKALLAAFVDGEHQIGVKQVKVAIKDAQFGALPGRSRRSNSRPLLLAGAMAALATVVAVSFWSLRASGSAVVQAPPAPSAVAAELERVTPAAAESPSDNKPATTDQMPASPLGLQNPVATSEAPLPLQASAELSAPIAAHEAGSDPAPISLTTAFSDAYSRWINDAAGKNYFIQLMRTNTTDHQDVERYLANTARLVDPESLRIYQSQADGQTWLGVVYGDFPSLEAALAAIDALPAPLREAGAYPRRVAMLK